VTTRANPFVGPRSFRAGEPLFGRARETAELVDLLIAERVVVMSSPSGAGKSSVINAAMLPRMRDQGFATPPVMRVSRSLPPEVTIPPGSNRFIVSLLLSLEEGREPASDRVPLHELLTMTFDAYLDDRQRESPNDSQVLVFDQFEEILTIDPEQRAAKSEFFDQVGRALRDRTRWALFAMREEFVAALQPYQRAIPTRFATQFRLDLLGIPAAIEAAREPARQAGVEFAAGAAELLVANLAIVRVQHADGTTGEEPGDHVEPVHLQVVCRRLFDRIPDAVHVIDSAVGQHVGEASTALADYYEQLARDAAKQAAVSERSVRDWVQRQLITESGIRGEVMQQPAHTAGLDNAAIAVLVAGYIVRAEKRRGATWYELSHDRMIDPIRAANVAWFDAHLSMLQRQAALWHAQNRPHGLLLRDSALEDAERWAAAPDDPLLAVEREFLEACRAERVAEARARSQARRLRVMSVVSVAALVVALVFYAQSVREQARLQDLVGDVLRQFGWSDEAIHAITRGQFAEVMQADEELATAASDTREEERHRVTIRYALPPTKGASVHKVLQDLQLGEVAASTSVASDADVLFDPDIDPDIAKIVANALLRAGVSVSAFEKPLSMRGTRRVDVVPDQRQRPSQLTVLQIHDLETAVKPDPLFAAVLEQDLTLASKIGRVTGGFLTSRASIQHFERGFMVWYAWDRDAVYAFTDADKRWRWFQDANLRPAEIKAVLDAEREGKKHFKPDGGFLRAWVKHDLKRLLGLPLVDELTVDGRLQPFTQGKMFAPIPFWNRTWHRYEASEETAVLAEVSPAVNGGDGTWDIYSVATPKP
jgi:hypothetical protein